MTIYLNDERDYSETIEGWVRDFISTMDEEDLEPGNRSGDEPPGVKIIFDGYGENDDGEPNFDIMSFAVFVHKDSLKTGEFPEHDFTPWALIHRPKEECCIYVWYDVVSDSVEVIPFEDNNSTNMDPEEVKEIIFGIQKEYYGNGDENTTDGDPSAWPFK